MRVANFAAFNRIRWRLFDPISDIVVEERSPEGNSMLVQFTEHSVSHEPATRSKLPKLEVTIDILAEKEDFDEHDEEDRYRSPTPLTVASEGDGPVTVGELISNLHAYVERHRHEISEEVVEMTPEIRSMDGEVRWRMTLDTPWIFDRFNEFTINREEGEMLSLGFIIRVVGKDGKTLNEEWASRIAATGGEKEWDEQERLRLEDQASRLEAALEEERAWRGEPYVEPNNP